MEKFNIIYGKNAVIEALTKGDRQINKILISKNLHTDSKLNQIKELAQKSKGFSGAELEESIKEALFQAYDICVDKANTVWNISRLQT